MKSRDNRLLRFLIVGCTAALLLLLVFLLADNYGVSWDEPFRWQGGEDKRLYYGAILRGDIEEAAGLRREGDRYPGLFDLTLALGRRFSPLDPVTTGHIWSALFGIAGIAGTFALGRLLGGPACGFLAALLLFLAPRYFGHMFINPKDIPFAATFVWGLWALLRATGDPKRLNPAGALVFGITAGACMAMRVGGLLLFAYAALFLAVAALLRFREKPSEATLLEDGKRLLPWFVISGATAFAVLFVFWPAMHRNPFAQTTETVAAITQFNWQGQVLFRGERFAADEVPWFYLPEMLGRTMPDLWVLLLGVALVGGILSLRTALRAKPAALSTSGWRVIALTFATLFPLAYIIYTGAIVYDGIRHVLFLLPLLALLIAVGTLSALRFLWAQPRKRPIAGLLTAAASLLALLSVYDLIRLHPYQYTYFNHLTGGLARADGRFETDYWGTAHREAVETLSAQLPPLSPRGDPWRLTMEPPLGVLIERFGRPVLPHPDLVRPFLGDNLILVRAHEDPDFYIAPTRNDYHLMRDGPVLLEIGRDGSLFLQVRLMQANLMVP